MQCHHWLYHLDFAGACFLYSMSLAPNISTQLASCRLLQAILSLLRNSLQLLQEVPSTVCDLQRFPCMQDRQAALTTLRMSRLTNLPCAVVGGPRLAPLDSRTAPQNQAQAGEEPKMSLNDTGNLWRHVSTHTPGLVPSFASRLLQQVRPCPI